MSSFQKWNQFLRPNWFQHRHYLVLLCFLNAMISYADRTNISIAILPMSDEYKWNNATSGFILSSFFYGYICTQLIGGYLSFKYGGKFILAWSCFLWSFFTILTPWSASLSQQYGLSVLIFCRIGLGLAEGVAFPSIMSMIPLYIPSFEHSRSISFFLTGCYVGAVMANLISPIFIDMPLFGWPFVFYFFGLFGLLWLFPWLWYALPDEISAFSSLEMTGKEDSTESLEMESTNVFSLEEEEGEVVDFEGIKILDAPPPKQLTTFQEKAPVDRSKRIPWGQLLSSRGVWAIIICQICQNWSYWLFINWLPTYYHNMFHADIKHIGFFTVIPYIVQGCTGILSGFIGDYLIHQKHYKKRFVRQLTQTISMVGVSIFMLLAAFAGNIYTGMLWVTCAMGIYNVSYAGVTVNHLDIAPEYSSIVYAMGNTAGQLPGMVGVAVTGWLLDVTGHNWLIVFGVAAIINIIGAILWCILCRTEPLKIRSRSK